MKKTEERIYASFDDDFETAADRSFRLPADYRLVRTDLGARLLSALTYGAALVFSFFYCRLVLHMRIKGKSRLRGVRGGCFIYGNHTQPLGDVFIPAHCAFPRRIYTVVSPANFSLPIIGKLLPYLGALPLCDSIHGYRALLQAMETRLRGGHPIVLYPEAHVWKYYTGIRPFPTAAFNYPARFECPAFAMTVTYQKARLFRRPRTTVWLDGPFYGEGNTAREKAEALHAAVYHAMRARAQSSDCAYIRYCSKA